MVCLLMTQRMGQLHVELAKKETEMTLLSQQRQEELRQSEERFAEQMRSQREQNADQLRSQREQSVEQLKAAREQFDEQLKTTKEQLRLMAQQLMDAQAQRLKEENKENMGSITQPLKDAISEMRKAISDNTKDHTEQSASLREQLRMMMESNKQIGEKAESLANVLRRDNNVSGNM